ncbi:MAG: diguanylate cyclase [Paucibacter sp.]|nr:diguanylate cyclase [Roseateles sp.]
MPLGNPLPLIEREHERRRRVVLVLISANVVVAALLAGLVLLVARAGREAYAVQARDTAVDLAAIAQASVSSEFVRLDALMRAALGELDAMNAASLQDDGAVNRVLDRYRELLPDVEGFRLVDAQGQVRWGNHLPPGGPVSVADRDYFIQARQHPDAGPAIAGPLRSRVSGNWVVALVRPHVVKGRFEGIIYTSLTTTHFQRLFAGFSVGDQDAMTLRRSDLQLVARFAPGSSAPLAVGSSNVSPELRAAIAREPNAGVLVTRTAMDDLERTTAYRRVSGWPFIVLAGLGTERFFAPWRQQVRHMSALAVVAWLLFAAASTAVYRSTRRETRSLRELSALSRRVQTLLRVAGDGIHIIDRQGRLVGMSDSFAQMLGSTRERLLGRHVSSWDVNQDEERITTWLAKVRDGDRQRVEVQHRRDDGSILDVELQISAAEIDGELFVYCSSRDITERKHLLASIEAQSARIRDLYDQAPCGYHSVDGEGRVLHINATLLGWLGCTAEEVLGRPLAEFLDAESQTQLAVEFARLKAEGSLDNVEIRILPRQGPPRRLRATLKASFDDKGEFVMSRCVTLDVTLEAEAMEQVRLMLREQTAMLDNDIVGMMRLRGRRLIWKNRAVDRIFGYGPGELDGQPVRLLYPDDETYDKVGVEGYPLLAAGKHYRTQLQLRHKDGRALWIDLCGVSLTQDLSLWTMADVTALKDAQARAEHLAFHDGLTGLPNRLLLADRIRHAIAASVRERLWVAVCYMDLDGFKQVNDLHGHDAGDALLVEVGQRIRSVLRAGDTAARVGGDEFVVLLTQLEPDGGWRHVLERLIQAIQKPVLLEGGIIVNVGTTIGVAISPQDGSEPSILLAKADQAMLGAKRTGKGRIEMATPG